MLLGKSTFNCHVLVISHEIIMESSNGRKCSQRLEIIAGKRPGTTDLTLQVKYWDTLAPTMSMSVSRLLIQQGGDFFLLRVHISDLRVFSGLHICQSVNTNWTFFVFRDLDFADTRPSCRVGLCCHRLCFLISKWLMQFIGKKID